MANPYAGMTNAGTSILPLATRILTLYKERKAAALAPITPEFRRFGRYYDAYRMYYTGRKGSRLEVQVPFVLSICQSDVSRKTQILFSSDPIVEFEGNSDEDHGPAQKVSALVSAQMLESDSFRKAADFFLSSDIYGTGIARVGWKHVSRYEKHRFVFADPMNPNHEIEQIKGGWVTRFDGPDWDVVDLMNFWPQPGKKHIKDMKWAMHCYPMELEDIQALGAGGVFDQAAVRQLEHSSMPKEVEEDYRVRSSYYRNYAVWSSSQDKFAKPVVCVDMVGEVPKEFAPDGVQFRLITVANDQVVLRNRPFPFWHGELNFVSYSPMPDIHSFYGIGKAEAAEKMQFLASRLASQKAAAIDQAVNPMWLVNRLMGVDTQNLITRPNGIIGVDGPVGDDIIRPLSPDLRGLQLSYNEIQQLWQWSQQATGIVEDTLMGMGQGGSDRQSATEVSVRQEGVLSRQMLEAHLGEVAVEAIGNFYHQYNKQFLKLPKQIKMLGMAAQINPETGLPLPQEPAQLDLNELGRDYKCIARGATKMMGKQQQTNNMMQALQLAQTNPVAVQILNWQSMFRYVFKVLNIPNVNEFFVQTIPAVTQLAGQEGGGPEALLGGEGGGLPPEIMQAISGGGPLAV